MIGFGSSSSESVRTVYVVGIYIFFLSISNTWLHSLRNPYQLLPITKYCHLNHKPMTSHLISGVSMDTTHSVLPRHGAESM